MALLLDIDGTLLERGEPIDGSRETIESLRERSVPFLFATNTSRKPRREVARSLQEAGIDAREEEVLSAGYAAASHLRAEGVKRVQLLLPPTSQEDFEALEITEDHPQAVVVGDMGELLTFQILNRAFRNLREGARLVAIHKNRFWRSRDGWTLDAGAIVTALEYAAQTDAELIGKPSPGFFRMAARILGVTPPALSIVGDDLESDIAGGRASRLTTILVKTGKFDARKLASVPPERAPHHVVDSIRGVVDIVDALR